MRDKKPKGGLPRWYPGERFLGATPPKWLRPPGWIVLVCLTPDIAVVRYPGAMTWQMSPREWLALAEEPPVDG